MYLNAAASELQNEILFFCLRIRKIIETQGSLYDLPLGFSTVPQERNRESYKIAKKVTETIEQLYRTKRFYFDSSLQSILPQSVMDQS